MSRVLPILFGTEMVRAILDGRKTVTRRVIKRLPEGTYRIEQVEENDWEVLYGIRNCGVFLDMYKTVKPPYQPGDSLYVRETWAQVRDIPHWNEYTRTEGHIPISPLEYVYKSDNVEVDGTLPEIKWHPSIHMPKEAARIWLKVTDVRVERLQDIRVLDCQHEGIDINRNGIFKRFSVLWNSAIRKSHLDRYGWAANPWVWVIEFERCEKPEGEL